MLKDANETAAKPLEDKSGLITQALERYDLAYNRDQENIHEAMEDLEFRAGDQWPEEVRREREAQNRPIMEENLLPQFIRQITGDIRQMKPAIRVVGVDDRANKETADIMAGMIRYVENRSDAQSAYFSAADSQVTCGIGHWRVSTEYAEESTFNQEIVIKGIEDGVSVLWDPDAVLPTREDAMWCFVPVDMSREAFKVRFPSNTPAELDQVPEGWAYDDRVRVAEYWVKTPIKRTLALLPDGTVDDLTDMEDEERAIADAMFARMAATGAPVRIEERDGFKVLRYLISATEILEGPDEWPGRYIPIVPVFGEEVRIGRRVVRHGAIRYAKDAQRRYNYYLSAQTEVVALQPKAPFIGTEDNFKKYEDVWSTANVSNHPFLPYQPDPTNGGQAPQRAQPPVSSQGFDTGLELALQGMKATIGIYDAGLGARSNETSGKAIMARQREGDVGSFVYLDNFARAVRYTGKILIDLIPHIYDTERTIRVMGEDGAVDLMKINQTRVVDGMRSQVVHDVTVGAYDVVVDVGPSYTTKREESREAMTAFLQSAPDAATLILDLYAKAQDWPMADQIAKRFRTMLPPQIQAMEAQEGGEAPPPMPSQQPSPEQQAQVMEAQMKAQEQQFEMQMKQIDLQMKQLDLQQKEVDLRAKAFEAQMRPQEPQNFGL